jgi:heme exporter protein B
MRRSSALTASAFINNIKKNLQKDYRIEFRNKYSINLSVSFAVISVLSISLIAGAADIPVKIQSILLWLVLFFSAMNGLSNIFIREEENGNSLFLRINSKPEIIFISKLLFNISLFFFLQIIIVPLFIFFLRLDVISALPFAGIMLSGGLAISSTTTILAAITSKSGGKGSLFTIISFPVILPVIWIASDATAKILSDPEYSGMESIIFLLAFSMPVTVLSYLLFNYIWAEE